MNRVYIFNISLFLSKLNFKYLFCSHRSFFYERLIYKACKLSKVKSISYDFSIGYPIRNKYKKELYFTTMPDIFIVKNNFRKEQYKLANKEFIELDKKPEIVKCKCMQVE